MTKRTAQTEEGKVVDLNTQRRVSGGWVSYVMDRKGFAVAIFVPGN